MNKSELIDFIAKDAKITKAEASKALESLMKGVKESLINKDKVTLIGFGTWSVVDKPARKARNPRTQEYIEVPAKSTVKFKSGFKM